MMLTFTFRALASSTVPILIIVPSLLFITVLAEQ